LRFGNRASVFCEILYSQVYWLDERHAAGHQSLYFCNISCKQDHRNYPGSIYHYSCFFKPSVGQLYSNFFLAGDGIIFFIKIYQNLWRFGIQVSAEAITFSYIYNRVGNRASSSYL
jgi:hypothetical protein